MDQDINKAHIFLSIDIVNSTGLKSEGMIGPQNIYDFLWLKGAAGVVDKLIERLPTFVVWKSIGDEVVFKTKDPYGIKISDGKLSFLHENDSVELLEVLRKSSEFVDGVNGNSDNKLKIKATLWMLPYYKKDEKDRTDSEEDADPKFEIKTLAKNIEVELKRGSFEQIDYIGTGMDHGFRIAGTSSEGNFVVSGLIVHVVCGSNVDVHKIDEIRWKKTNKDLNEFEPKKYVKNDSRPIYKITPNNTEQESKDFIYLKRIGYSPLKGLSPLFAIFTVAHNKSDKDINHKNLIRLAHEKEKDRFESSKYRVDLDKIKETLCSPDEFSFPNLVIECYMKPSRKEREFFGE